MTEKPPQSLVRFVYSDAVTLALGGRYKWKSSSSGVGGSLPSNNPHLPPPPVTTATHIDTKKSKKEQSSGLR